MNQSAGSVTPLSADEILTALGSGKWPVFRMDSVGGSANAITASVSGLTLTSGQYFWLVPASNSSSTTVNLNLNSGGNVRVKKADGSTDPASGDLQAGVIALLYYDGTYYRQMTGMPVSATDTSALALDGSRTMTGAVNMGSGSKAFWSASGTLSSTQYEATRTAGGTLFINAPSSGDIEIGNAGSGKLNVNSAGVRVLGTGGTGHFLRQTSSNGVISSAALTPSDMPYSAVGATFANDGNWYNLYSLAQGTHNGEIKIACALFGGLVTFTINGTSISLINDDWGGSYADTTAASGKIAFRVSGGYLQINVGTGISSTPRKFLAIFNGTVN